MPSMYSCQIAVGGWGGVWDAGLSSIWLAQIQEVQQDRSFRVLHVLLPSSQFPSLLFPCRHVVEILGELYLQICFGFNVAVWRRRSYFLPMWGSWSDETSTFEMVPSHSFSGGCGKMLVLEKAPVWLARVRSLLNLLICIFFSKQFFMESSSLNWWRHKLSNAVKLIWDSLL